MSSLLPTKIVPLHPLRVFVVEHHADTRRCLQLYLETVGHTVRSAATAAAALSALPGADYDVLICDVGLPDGTGWDLLHRLPAPRPAYAIAMSACGTHADQVRARAAGYRHHLLKPFPLPEFDAMLEEAAHELLLAR